MPHDPELVAETRGWLAKAALDLRAADHSLTAVPPLVDDIVFHAQQAAEKCFKAFFHSLEELGEQCLAIDASLKVTVDRAVPLTEYAPRLMTRRSTSGRAVSRAAEPNRMIRSG